MIDFAKVSLFKKSNRDFAWLDFGADFGGNFIADF